MSNRTSSRLLATTFMFIMTMGFMSQLNAQVYNSGGAQPLAATAVAYSPTVTQGGPGTEMTAMINRLGLGSDCGHCKTLANQMDQGGPTWVQQNRQYVVQQTISNATSLGHRMGPAKKLGVRWLVARSILKSNRP